MFSSRNHAIFLSVSVSSAFIISIQCLNIRRVYRKCLFPLEMNTTVLPWGFPDLLLEQASRLCFLSTSGSSRVMLMLGITGNLFPSDLRSVDSSSEYCDRMLKRSWHFGLLLMYLLKWICLANGSFPISPQRISSVNRSVFPVALAITMMTLSRWRNVPISSGVVGDGDNASFKMNSEIDSDDPMTSKFL